MPSPSAGGAGTLPTALGPNYYNSAMPETATAIQTGAKNLTGFYIDNRANSSSVFLKLWDLATGGVTVGTTAPDVIVRCLAGEELEWPLEYPVAFTTAVTGALVTTGGDSGTTAATQSVPVVIGLN